MNTQQTKTDLIKYLKNSILAKVKQLARFPDTISSVLLGHLYKDIVQKTTTEEVMNKMMYQIFEFTKEQSAEFYEFVQTQKRQYQAFWEDTETFYKNEEAQAIFEMQITDKQEPACNAKELFSIIEGQPTMVKLEHKLLIHKKYDKNYRKLFTISIKGYESLSELLKTLCDFGSINAAFVHNKELIVQFYGYESVLAMAYKLEDIKFQLSAPDIEIFSVYEVKVSAKEAHDAAEITTSLEETPKSETDAEQPPECVILTNLPQQYRMNGIFGLSAVNFRFVKAVYALEGEEDSILLEFITRNSSVFFMKHFKADDVECRPYNGNFENTTRIIQENEKQDEM